MVGLIGGLQLGPTDTTAKLLEQSIAIVQFIVGGMVFGAIVNSIGFISDWTLPAQSSACAIT